MAKHYKYVNGKRLIVVNNYELGSDVIPEEVNLIPDITQADEGKVLTADENGEPKWTSIPSQLPTLSGNSGKVLKVNSGATGVEWDDESTELPSLTGNADKVLKVNSAATGVEWAEAGGGGGGGTLYVQLTPDDQNYTFTTDKTFNEVAEAVKNGYYVTGYIPGTPKIIIPLQLFNVYEYEDGVYDGYLKFRVIDYGGESVVGQMYLYLEETGFEWTMDNSEPVEGKTYTHDKSYFNFVLV